MTTFELPINVHVGDKIVINDFESHKTFMETVTAEPILSGEKVQIWTDKRLLHCDAGLKVAIRREGNEGSTPR